MPADLSKAFKHKCTSSSSRISQDTCCWRLDTMKAISKFVPCSYTLGTCKWCQSLKGELGLKFIEGGFSLSPVCSAQAVEASTCLIISTFKIAFCLSGSEKSPDRDDFCFHLRIILSALPLQSEKCSGTAEMEWKGAAKIHSHSLGILMSLLGISGHLLPRLFLVRIVLCSIKSLLVWKT